MAKYFTSESVSAGHPDKIADQIADAILDAVLEQDPKARSAVEVTTSTGDVSIFGELSTNAYVNIRKIATDTIREIGYNHAELGFTADSVNVSNKIVEQSGILHKLSIMQKMIQTNLELVIKVWYLAMLLTKQTVIYH